MVGDKYLGVLDPRHNFEDRTFRPVRRPTCGAMLGPDSVRWQASAGQEMAALRQQEHPKSPAPVA